MKTSKNPSLTVACSELGFVHHIVKPVASQPMIFASFDLKPGGDATLAISYENDLLQLRTHNFWLLDPESAEFQQAQDFVGVASAELPHVSVFADPRTGEIGIKLDVLTPQLTTALLERYIDICLGTLDVMMVELQTYICGLSTISTVDFVAAKTELEVSTTSRPEIAFH